MSSSDLEAFLASIYSDSGALKRFLADPRGEAARAGLDKDEIEAMATIDREGLIMAASSFRRKRSLNTERGGKYLGWLYAVFNWLLSPLRRRQ